ncbi:putative ferrichrome transport ATP-binding protein FhuC [Candidatus Erwinia dacicola]|uniref:Ferrichrome transport ATP-binding protein FhuC n=1 Tax=Candidatus Erwinia dacicola TaxID=252393 RepID=A0A328TMY5_9GAMM|nr:putative ferrichrome transport ATP-binding protein FhuC [Candidatus Erwinia dacicola]
MHDINIALRHGEHVLMLQNSELIVDELPEEVITRRAWHGCTA